MYRDYRCKVNCETTENKGTISFRLGSGKQGTISFRLGSGKKGTISFRLGSGKQGTKKRDVWRLR